MKKHAYLIIAHNKFDQLAMLCRLLNDQRNDFYIMIDAKADNPPNADYLLPDGGKSHIYFTDRVNVTWGGYSQIEAVLTVLEAALNSGIKYDYYHLLSGVDLPIKTNDEICKFFEANQGKEFLHFCDYEFSKGNSVRERASLYHFFQEKAGRSKNGFWYLCERISLKIQRLLHVNRIRNKEVFCGANWFSITTEFARYIISQKQWIYKNFSKGLCVDELFIQTLIMNSPFKENLYHKKQDNDCHGNMRFVDWERGNPYTWKYENFDELINSDYLFARKFDIDADREICEKIYTYLEPET